MPSTISKDNRNLLNEFHTIQRDNTNTIDSLTMFSEKEIFNDMNIDILRKKYIELQKIANKYRTQNDILRKEQVDLKRECCEFLNEFQI